MHLVVLAMITFMAIDRIWYVYKCQLEMITYFQENLTKRPVLIFVPVSATLLGWTWMAGMILLWLCLEIGTELHALGFIAT